MKFAVFNMPEQVDKKPYHIITMDASSYEVAFEKCRRYLCRQDILELVLHIPSIHELLFTDLEKDMSLGYGEKMMYFKAVAVNDKHEALYINTYGIIPLE